jgi:hypothetical protein
MKKIMILLCINVLMFTYIKSMENLDMDIETHNNSEKTSHQHDASNTKSNNNNQTNKLLKDNNILLHTLIMQNKIHFEYQDSVKHDPRQSINLHTKDALVAVDNLYKSHNSQIKDKALHIPMTGKTEIAKTTKNNETKDII